MLGLIAVLGSLVCSGIWVVLFFSGAKSRLVFGLTYETYMFLSVAFAAASTILLRIGI